MGADLALRLKSLEKGFLSGYAKFSIYINPNRNSEMNIDIILEIAKCEFQQKANRVLSRKRLFDVNT